MLHSILVQSFSNLQVPNSWKVAEVTPVPKCLPIALKQLRPISKLPTFSKIMEKFDIRQMKKYFRDIMTNSQYAYRAQSSTSCALLAVINFACQNLDKADCVAVAMVSIDFSDAFNRIDHCLLNKKTSKH